MGINSKKKGARGERDWAKICREHGFEVRRSQQYAGGTESADVIGLPGVHCEVKAWDTITTEDIRKFLAQAIRDSAGSGNIPIVAHKEDYRKWFVSMEWDDFVRMYVEATGISGTVLTKSQFQQIYFVTIPADDWFMLYREYAVGLEANTNAQTSL